MPCKAGHNLGQIYVFSVDQHLAKSPAVSIRFAPLDADGLSIHQVGKILFRAIAEILFFLRRVNSRKSDLVLTMGIVEHRDGVAVADANDFPNERFRHWRDHERHEPEGGKELSGSH